MIAFANAAPNADEVLGQRRAGRAKCAELIAWLEANPATPVAAMSLRTLRATLATWDTLIEAAEADVDAAWSDATGALVDVGDEVSFQLAGGRVAYGTVEARQWVDGYPSLRVREPGEGGGETILVPCMARVLDLP